MMNVDPFPSFPNSQPQEAVLWQGQSDPACWRKSNLVALRVIAVMFFSITAFLVWRDWHNWYLISLDVLALMLVRGSVPTGRYMITDRCVARYNQYGPGKQELAWNQVGNIRLRESPDGTGTVIFEPSFTSLKDPIRFFCVAQASDVHKIGLQAKQSADCSAFD